MAGIVGIFAFDPRWNISRFLYFSLKAIQNRGQETAGITVSDFENLRCLKGSGLVENTIKERDVEKFRGPIGIAAVSTEKTSNEEKMMPIISGNFALGFSGGLMKDGSEVNDAPQTLCSLLSGKEEREEIVEALEKQELLGCLVAMGKDRFFAYRDPHGLRPLLKGNLGFELALISSETGAMDVIGGDWFFDVEPGELCYFDKYGFESEKVRREKPVHCAFEYIYLSRPDNVWNGIHVEEVRYKIGKEIARENPIDDFSDSVVIAVPETARAFANGFSDEAGIPQRLGFERVGTHVRAAITPSQFERMMGIQLKHNVIRSAVYGKKVYVLDDSVVRGNTLRNTVFWLRKRGAKEVHVRIGSPHLISPCKYGMEVPIKDELIAVHNTEAEIAQIIDADSFAYLSVDSMVGCIGIPRKNLCVACMTGEYPFGD